jgi:hypothetical protein
MAAARHAPTADQELISTYVMAAAEKELKRFDPKLLGETSIAMVAILKMRSWIPASALGSR